MFLLNGKTTLSDGSYLEFTIQNVPIKYFNLEENFANLEYLQYKMFLLNIALSAPLATFPRFTIQNVPIKY